jgi:alpha-galactosidase
MKDYSQLKIAIIGAGSVSFSPCMISDIVLSDEICARDTQVSLMDIRKEALPPALNFAVEAAGHMGRDITFTATTDLEEALAGADFVITAVEVDRLYYWSQDWHILRKYGFRQIFGENGGPGSMFHTLRNLPPIIEIAKAMERVCPDAWLLNFTNPEAKLVEAVLKLTGIRAVGLCHGTNMGIEQLADMLEMDEEDLDVRACGMNHFGWFESIKDKKTGKDLYPELKERELRMNWTENWNSWALSRIMLRTYGLLPYPGTCHIGEYIAWSDQFDGSIFSQYYYDPAHESPWKRKVAPHSDYTFEESEEAPPRYPEEGKTFEDMDVVSAFDFRPELIEASGEVAIDAIEGMITGERRDLSSTNMMNDGIIPNLPDNMVIEVTSYADGEGIHGVQMEPLPIAVAEMIRVQGTIAQLILDAYTEQSKNSLLQAMLLDPAISTYYNAVSAIDEMTELQKDILPPLHW